jgi:hypothetical protein
MHDATFFPRLFFVFFFALADVIMCTWYMTVYTITLLSKLDSYWFTTTRNTSFGLLDSGN